MTIRGDRRPRLEQRSREEIRGLGYVGSSPYTLNLRVLHQYPQSLGDSCLHISEVHGTTARDQVGAGLNWLPTSGIFPWLVL